MSYFGNDEKDDLLYEIRDFLKNHNISTLLEVVYHAILCEEDERYER